MLYDFKRGLKVAELARCISIASGEKTVSECTTQSWLAGFPSGDHDVENQPRLGRSSGLDEERLHQLVNDDPQNPIRQLAEALGRITIICG